jgi:hypothetical protein
MLSVISKQIGNQERTLHFATTGTLHGKNLPGLELNGKTDLEALLFSATSEFVTSARKVGGLRCGSGRIRVEGVLLGMLLFMGDCEGHVLLLPVGAPEIRGAIRRALACGRLLAVASAPNKDSTLIVVNTEKLETLREASKNAQPMRPEEMPATLAMAGRALFTARAAELLPPSFAGLTRVCIHMLLPDSLCAGHDGLTRRDTVPLH